MAYAWIPEEKVDIKFIPSPLVNKPGQKSPFFKYILSSIFCG